MAGPKNPQYARSGRIAYMHAPPSDAAIRFPAFEIVPPYPVGRGFNPAALDLAAPERRLRKAPSPTAGGEGELSREA